MARRAALGLLLSLLWAGPALGAGPTGSASPVARVTAMGAVLRDSLLSLRWSIDRRDHVRLMQARDAVTGRQWALPGGPEFSMELDSLPTSSVTGWRLLSATASRDGGAAALTFRYGLVARRGLVELDRVWRLYPGAAVAQVSARMVNSSPAVVRVGKYTLASLSAGDFVSAEVQAYHGGSDWRQDFRSVTREPGTFDDEGEVARFDDGTGAGWFLVGERRGGAMSRVGRDAGGTSWVGVDNARDLFDYGPLMSSPPNYNRLENPAYPVPVRQRTLAPLGTLDLGRAYLGVYHGGASQAAAVFAGDFAAHVMPRDRQTVDLNSFHPWNHGPGLSDQNLRRQADVFARAGGEVLMLDDQWQGASAGDWNWDTARFPVSGTGNVPDFVKYLHSRGLQLGLWMSPAEFNPASATYSAHPDWACTPVGDATARVPDDSGLGVWDMTNPGLRAHLSDAIDRLIAQDGVREFKFDYVAFVDCPPHDYLDYEDAYAAWIREQEVRHPGVTFELDETNDQRLWAFRSAALGPSWFDNGHLQGSTYPARELHDVWSSAPWLPPSSLGFGSYDGDLKSPYSVGYLMPLALLGHVTFWSDLTQLSDAQVAETAWWTHWYEAHRDALSGVVYEDTATDPIAGTAPVALQPWTGDRGYLFLFTQSDPLSEPVALQGLDPARMYRLTDVRTRAVLGSYSGAQLEAGVSFTLPPYTAQVLAVEPAG